MDKSNRRSNNQNSNSKHRRKLSYSRGGLGLGSIVNGGDSNYSQNTTNRGMKIPSSRKSSIIKHQNGNMNKRRISNAAKFHS